MVRETAGNTGSGKNISDSNVFEILTSTAPSSESRKNRPPSEAQSRGPPSASSTIQRPENDKYKVEDLAKILRHSKSRFIAGKLEEGR